MAEHQKITKKEARRFLLLKHGLLGDRKFIGKEGVLNFVKQVGCVQYDPIDVCGKNHELVFQSRIEGLQKEWIYDLLYKDRVLIDWFDKNMSIMQTSDWIYFEDDRKRAKEFKRNRKEIDEVSEDVLEFVKKNGIINSSDLEYTQKVDWWWAPTSFSRVVLDALYYQGELIIHHKKNTRKYYDLAINHLSKKLLEHSCPFENKNDKYKWHITRRIGSVGMLHHNASYAFIGINGLKTKERALAYKELLANNIIYEIFVDQIEKPFYLLTQDKKLLDEACNLNDIQERIEFLAPLDNLLWDRKLIEEIFNYSYKWEIYTPIKDRKHGYYVLPILLTDELTGRIEIKRNRKTKEFDLLGLWWEDEKYNTKKINEMVNKHIKYFHKILY